MANPFRLENNYIWLWQHGVSMAISNLYHFKKTEYKLGSGNCFMGELIYEVVNKIPSQKIIDFALPAAVGKINQIGVRIQQTIAQINASLL